jgi:hypothetical protein
MRTIAGKEFDHDDRLLWRDSDGVPATRTLPRASGGSSASSSDQDAGKPIMMVQPQRAAPPAEPALQTMPPVTRMTSNRASVLGMSSFGYLPLVLKCGPPGGCSARAYNRRGTVPGWDRPRFVRGQGRSPVPVSRADLSGIWDAPPSPPSPSPICRGRGRSGSPVTVPDSHRAGGSAPCPISPARARRGAAPGSTPTRNRASGTFDHDTESRLGFWPNPSRELGFKLPTRTEVR